MTYCYAVHFEFFMHLHVMNTENNNVITIIMIIVKIFFINYPIIMAVGINWRTVFMSIICKRYIMRMMDTRIYLPEELHPPRSDKALLSVNAYKCCIFIMLICLTPDNFTHQKKFYFSKF